MTRALVRASHPLPCAAVTVVMTCFAWAIGWRGLPLAVLAAAVLAGQLSVGWSNDAHDADLDARAARAGKPTVSGAVTAGTLWRAASGAVALAALLSWVAAGWIGGTMHVVAIGMAWLYNVRLSRTAWSWLPYAVAFGLMPAFLSYGLTGTAPPTWQVAVFALVAVAGHLANALPDLAADRDAGVDGAVLRLGRTWATVLCWALLAAGSALLAAVVAPARPAVAVAVGAAYLAGLAFAVVGRRASSSYLALLAVVLVDVVALVLAGALA